MPPPAGKDRQRQGRGTAADISGTLPQSAVVVAASLIGGKLSDRTRRRKIFVLTASLAGQGQRCQGSRRVQHGRRLPRTTTCPRQRWPVRDRSRSLARRTAARRLFTPSLA